MLNVHVDTQWKMSGCLGCIGDDKLRSYVGIIINHEIRISIKQPPRWVNNNDGVFQVRWWSENTWPAYRPNANAGRCRDRRYRWKGMFFFFFAPEIDIDIEEV